MSYDRDTVKYVNYACGLNLLSAFDIVAQPFVHLCVSNLTIPFTPSHVSMLLAICVLCIIQMASLMATSPLPSSARSHQPSKGSSPFLSPSRKAATVNLLPPSTEADVSGNTKTSLHGRKDNTVATRKPSYTAGIAEEKEELLSLLEDIPKMYQSMHPSYTLLPWAYKIYLAVDCSEPSEMAKAHCSLPSCSDPVDDESREEKEGSPQLEDTVLPSSLSLKDRRKIYQMVYSVLPCTSHSAYTVYI